VCMYVCMYVHTHSIWENIRNTYLFRINMPTLHSIVSHQNENLCETTGCHFKCPITCQSLKITYHISGKVNCHTYTCYACYCTADFKFQTNKSMLWSTCMAFRAICILNLVTFQRAASKVQQVIKLTNVPTVILSAFSRTCFAAWIIGVT
jgi:hypothetical protein